MGNRYLLGVECPQCGYIDRDVYYAPTCGIVDWMCPYCKCLINLEEYTGISYQDASNKEVIRDLVEELRELHY
jgi:hypothetical protein